MANCNPCSFAVNRRTINSGLASVKWCLRRLVYAYDGQRCTVIPLTAGFSTSYNRMAVKTGMVGSRTIQNTGGLTNNNNTQQNTQLIFHSSGWSMGGGPGEAVRITVYQWKTSSSKSILDGIKLIDPSQLEP